MAFYKSMKAASLCASNSKYMCVCVYIHTSMMMVHVWGNEGQHASEAEYLSPVLSFSLFLPSFLSFLFSWSRNSAWLETSQIG